MKLFGLLQLTLSVMLIASMTFSNVATANMEVPQLLSAETFKVGPSKSPDKGYVVVLIYDQVKPYKPAARSSATPGLFYNVGEAMVTVKRESHRFIIISFDRATNVEQLSSRP